MCPDQDVDVAAAREAVQTLHALLVRFYASAPDRACVFTIAAADKLRVALRMDLPPVADAVVTECNTHRILVHKPF